MTTSRQSDLASATSLALNYRGTVKKNSVLDVRMLSHSDNAVVIPEKSMQFGYREFGKSYIGSISELPSPCHIWHDD